MRQVSVILTYTISKAKWEAVRLPFGHEGAGGIEEVGEGVTLAEAGDKVIISSLRSCGRCYYCSIGSEYHCEGQPPRDELVRLHTKDGDFIRQGMGTSAFAEHTVVDQSQVVKIPEDLTFDRACLLVCCVITGVGAVFNTAKVAPGSSVVVIGTGGVGLNAEQGAAIAGASRIVAVDILDSKLEAARNATSQGGLRWDIPGRAKARPMPTGDQLTEAGLVLVFRQGLSVFGRWSVLSVVVPESSSNPTPIDDSGKLGIELADALARYMTPGEV